MTDLNTLLQINCENELLEFKEARRNYDADKLGKYFSALSNEANLKNKEKAYFLMGVKDDKTTPGTLISDETVNSFKLEISNNTSPTMSFIDVERIATENDDVLCFIIPAAPQGMPVSWKDHYYGRSGESLGGLDLSEIERIRNQTVNKDWSIKIVEEATIEDLSKEAIDFARKQFAEKNPRIKDEIEKWDDVVFLNKAKVILNGKITNTAILLLGKPESEHFLTPATSTITWILKDRDGIEKDYEHFSCPLILSIQQVYSKIRNIKYRYIRDNTLFPEEVVQYDPYTIRESLNNCVAHQDYTMGGKIVVVEKEDGELVFMNSGDFIPETIEKVIRSDVPETRYRNTFLSNAMVNLNMIDTIGSGIKKMFVIQKNKFFPLPDYDLSNHSVKLTITGKVLDVDYARKLATDNSLSLFDIMLLDKVQKHKDLTDEEYKTLKKRGLLEGRRNNYVISSSVAKITDQQTDYMNLKGIDDEFCRKQIIEYIKKFGSATREKLESYLIDKLSKGLTEQQKKDKVKNNLQNLKHAGKIKVNPNSKHREWILVSSKS